MSLLPRKEPSTSLQKQETDCVKPTTSINSVEPVVFGEAKPQRGRVKPTKPINGFLLVVFGEAKSVTDNANATTMMYK
jgi:NaMN:DMB phosphoribosyltransferase